MVGLNPLPSFLLTNVVVLEGLPADLHDQISDSEFEGDELQFLYANSVKSVYATKTAAPFVGTTGAPMETEDMPTSCGFLDMKSYLEPGFQALPLRSQWRAFELDESVYHLALGDSIISRVQLNIELTETIVHAYPNSRSDEKKKFLNFYPDIRNWISPSSRSGLTMFFNIRRHQPNKSSRRFSLWCKGVTLSLDHA